jgi:hypothetical protein
MLNQRCSEQINPTMEQGLGPLSFASRFTYGPPCSLLQDCPIVCPIVYLPRSWCQINSEYRAMLCAGSEAGGNT